MKPLPSPRAALITGAAVGLGTTCAAAAWTTASLLHGPSIPTTGVPEPWHPDDDVRYAVVLGIGGVVGASWSAATIARLSTTDLDPFSAGLVIGTSAGALTAAALRSGLTPLQVEQFAVTGSVTHHGVPVHLPDPVREPQQAVHRPNILSSTAHQLLHRHLPPVASVAVGFLPPRGFTLERVTTAVDTLYQIGAPMRRWPERPTWIPAVNAVTGQRVVFGLQSGNEVTIGQAVAASCAVPGIMAPVVIDGQWYIDGGVASFTSIDLAVLAGARRILVLNPIAGIPSRRGGVAGHIQHAIHSSLAQSFRRSVRRAQRQGVQVKTVTPSPEEVQAIGIQPLAFDRGPGIREAVARRSYSRDDITWQ